MPRRRVARPLKVALLALATALVLTGCGNASGPQSSSRVITSPSVAGGDATTREQLFSPYSPRGAVLPGLDVTETVRGTCVSPGVAGRSSYRCFAQPGTTTYDPCFAPAHATSGPLMCVADPADAHAVSFDVGSLPSAAGPGPSTQPWAMELANGQTCVLVSAAWVGLGPFACPSPARSSPSEADCHTPRKGGVGFEAACQAKESAASTFRTVRVTKIWT